jgi:predicted secreted protein
VQGYQLVKTAALPQLGGAPHFEPLVVARSAAGVLDFLRQHCSREGASYWLKKVRQGFDAFRNPLIWFC